MKNAATLISVDKLRSIISACVSEQVAVALAAHSAEKNTELPIQLHESKYMTRKEAAKSLGVTITTIDNYLSRGLLTKKKVGSRAVRLIREEVDRLARVV